MAQSDIWPMTVLEVKHNSQGFFGVDMLIWTNQYRQHPISPEEK
jgi:hypothetical protein